MSIKAGLVGLPNIGKSTIFNALTKSSVPAENYPFCTIDPHVACTFVPDERISKLQKIYNSQKTIPTTVEFVDIAGLVKGAASGEGLGNQFLSHIREVDLILHVLRCFDDPRINYSRDEVDPIIDYEIIVTEFILKDLETIEKRLVKLAHIIKTNKDKPLLLKPALQEEDTLKKIREALDKQDEKLAKELANSCPVKIMDLLSIKNFLIIANISESEIQDKQYINNPNYKKVVAKFGQEKVIPVCAKLEAELSKLSDEEKEEIASMMGLETSGLNEVISRTYKNLELITYFTCGPKEIHAWTIPNNTKVRKAAGEIHSDLEKGFICAEVFNCSDLFEFKTESKLKEVGKIRTEGQDYLVKDGDVLNIRFNV